jgi:hypothetical protein
MTSRPDFSALNLSAACLIEAMDGVVYLVDGDGVIQAFSAEPAARGAENSTGAVDGKLYVGRCLFSFVADAEVRDSYRTLHAAVWTRSLRCAGFEYRCDEAAMERRMRMSISLIEVDGAAAAVLYQSVLLSETPRVPLPLFAADMLRTGLPRGGQWGGQRGGQRGGQWGARCSLRLCSYCQDVAWPVEPAEAWRDREWISAIEFYRRGGPPDAVVSHGICPACYDRVVQPAVQAMAARNRVFKGFDVPDLPGGSGRSEERRFDAGA